MQFQYGYKSKSFAEFSTKHFRLLSCLYILYTIGAILLVVYLPNFHMMLSSLFPSDLITLIIIVFILIVVLAVTSLLWLAATGIMIALIIVRYKQRSRA